MKTIYNTASSLDGFIADANNSLNWLFQFPDPPEGSFDDFLSTIGAVAMGSTTYEWLLENEINKDPESPRPWPYKQPAWVFSSRKLPAVEGADIRFVAGDVRPVHAEMARAAGDRNIWLVGGGELVGQFHDHGLLDEVIVTIASVTLGGGAPLLPRMISHPPMRLVSVKAYGEAFAELKYEVVRS